MNDEENKEELSIYDSLQLIALRDYLQPDESSFFRKLCRWFSATFHTSIMEVEKQSFEYLLMHYNEWRLENMTKEELEKHKKFLLNKEEVLEDEEDDDAFAEQMELEFIKQRQAELDKLKNKKVEPEPAPPDIKMTF